eukprot:5955-Alexandrium_andersonii.AAC.1
MSSGGQLRPGLSARRGEAPVGPFVAALCVRLATPTGPSTGGARTRLLLSLLLHRLLGQALQGLVE